MDAIKQNFDRRATEKTLSIYLNKVVDGLQKECGERPTYQNNISQPSVLMDHYQTEDSVILKDAFNALVEKM